MVNPPALQRQRYGRIEAVCGTGGQPGLPDSIVRAPGGVGTVPWDRIALRIRNSVGEKKAKFDRYLHDGHVNSIDSLVIALNVYEIPYADFDSPRYVTRALYGIGNQVLRIALTDNPKIVDSTYEQVVSIPKLSTGAPVGGVLRTTRSPHGFCCMRLPLSCFEQSFSQRLTHVRAVQFVTA